MDRPVIAPAALAEWLQALCVVEESVHRALVQSESQGITDDDPEDEFLGSYESKLNSLEERLAGLQSQVAAAGRIADEVVSLLIEDERHSREWLEMANRARRRLAGLPANCLS